MTQINDSFLKTKEATIRQALYTDEGREALANAMVEPFRLKNKIPQQALSWCDRDTLFDPFPQEASFE